MKHARTTIAASLSAALLALTLTGCMAPSATEPGDGPAVTQPADDPAGTETEVTEGESATEEPTEDATEETPDEPSVADFSQKYVYPDGVEVEITKIKHGTLTSDDLDYVMDSDAHKAGDAYVVLTARVKNGSKASLDAYESWKLSQGADGDAVESDYVSSAGSDTDLSGTILPGKAKSGTETFIISKKQQTDAVLEFNFDFEHDAAVFSGSLR